MKASEMIKMLRDRTGLNRKEFSLHFRIPLRTVEDWETGRRTPPEYLPILLEYQIKYEELWEDNDCTKSESARKNINVIIDEDGRSIVLINDVRFKSRRTIDWEQVEEYLKESFKDNKALKTLNNALVLHRRITEEVQAKYSSKVNLNNEINSGYAFYPTPNSETLAQNLITSLFHKIKNQIINTPLETETYYGYDGMNNF